MIGLHRDRSTIRKDLFIGSIQPAQRQTKRVLCLGRVFQTQCLPVSLGRFLVLPKRIARSPDVDMRLRPIRTESCGLTRRLQRILVPPENAIRESGLVPCFGVIRVQFRRAFEELQRSGVVVTRHLRDSLRIVSLSRRSFVFLRIGRQRGDGLKLIDLKLQNSLGGNGKIQTLTLGRLKGRDTDHLTGHVDDRRTRRPGTYRSSYLDYLSIAGDLTDSRDNAVRYAALKTERIPDDNYGLALLRNRPQDRQRDG